MIDRAFIAPLACIAACFAGNVIVGIIALTLAAIYIVARFNLED